MGTAAAALARTGALRARARALRAELLYPRPSRWFGGARAAALPAPLYDWRTDRWDAGSRLRPPKPRPLVSIGRIPRWNTGRNIPVLRLQAQR